MKKRSQKNQAINTEKITSAEKPSYYSFLKKHNFQIDYKNIRSLQAFVNNSGRIKRRVKTKLSIKLQKLISKTIKKARAFKALPFTAYSSKFNSVDTKKVLKITNK